MKQPATKKKLKKNLIGVRCTDEQMVRIKRAASASGAAVSTWLLQQGLLAASAQETRS